MPCSSKLRIGIFGGAFDPPHLGHEKAVLAFLEKARLDLLYVIPSGKPPHKLISGGARDEDRLEMSRLSFLPLSDRIRISDSEIKDQGTCYSYITVERVLEMHPDSDLFLFIGTDQFLAFETWRRFEYILKLCTLCVMDRFEDFSKLNEKKARLEENFGARVLLLEEKPYIISSTDIRRQVSEWGFSLSLAPAVNEYIAEKELYCASSDSLRRSILKKAKSTLSPHRFFHTLAVEREAVRIGSHLDLPPEDIREMALAALYHDLAKDLSADEAASYLYIKGEKVTDEDLEIPAVLHGRVAAQMAKEAGVFSAEAIDAICYHTTGRKGMHLKEKILYFADYIEETRTHKACQSAREVFYRNFPDDPSLRLTYFDQQVIKVMENVARHLKENNLPFHSLGEAALADMKQRTK